MLKYLLLEASFNISQNTPEKGSCSLDLKFFYKIGRNFSTDPIRVKVMVEGRIPFISIEAHHL